MYKESFFHHSFKPKSENFSLITTFSQKEIKKLKREGNKIVKLTGKTYEELAKDSPQLFSTSEARWLYLMDPKVFTIPSLLIHVAFNPHRFILEESDRKTFAEQSQLMRDSQPRSLKKIPLSILGLPEYLEIISQYFRNTGTYLLNDGTKIRTSTQIGEYNQCNISINDYKINPDLNYGNIPWKNLFIAPVYIPKATFSHNQKL